MSTFIGRQSELQRLRQLMEKKTASFVLVNGRRRIGKSRLICELGKYFEQFYSFVGLAPDKGTTAKMQLEEFSRQVARQFKTAPAYYNDWSDVFWALGERVKSGRVLLFFDEISWMGDKDTTFLSKIKNLWDLQLKENNKLIFVICGSASSWIEKNILSNTGFVGRISFTLTLTELPLSDCSKFWPPNICAYEMFKILAITGGVPKYLEEVNPKYSAEENIKRLCFTKGGFLVKEFDQIFKGTFLRKSKFYEKIIFLLADGAKDQAMIKLDITLQNKYGRIAEYLAELELAGFITRDYSWNLKNSQDVELSKYRLSDNYLRFYCKYIAKNLSKIKRNAFALKSLTSLPEWYSILGFQFENLVLNNRKKIHQLLNLTPEEIVCENPYFQRKTTRVVGCQIDYLIQTKFGTLYVCEIKFSKAAIDVIVVQEVQTKINALKLPRGYSCRPVLIHVNGVTDELVESDYFARIINFSELLAE